MFLLFGQFMLCFPLLLSWTSCPGFPPLGSVDHLICCTCVSMPPPRLLFKLQSLSLLLRVHFVHAVFLRLILSGLFSPVKLTHRCLLILCFYCCCLTFCVPTYLLIKALLDLCGVVHLESGKWSVIIFWSLSLLWHPLITSTGKQLFKIRAGKRWTGSNYCCFQVYCISRIKFVTFKK